jgi:hypothetical protein
MENECNTGFKNRCSEVFRGHLDYSLPTAEGISFSDYVNHEKQIAFINQVWAYTLSQRRYDNLLESLNQGLKSWIESVAGSEDPKEITQTVNAYYQAYKFRDFFETPVGKQVLFDRNEHEMLKNRGVQLIYDENYPLQFNLRFEKY